MARKKKNEILDTRSGDLILDINAPDEDRTMEGLLRLETIRTNSDTNTVSFRMPTIVLDHAKQLAREISVKEKRDIHYQKLILESFLRVHPMKEEEK
jgi:hypothetical protein